MQEANEWKGEGYKAVILTGLPLGNNSSPLPQEYQTAYPGKPNEKIARAAFTRAEMNGLDFRERYERAPRLSKEDENFHLEKARQGLEAAVLGLTAYSTSSREWANAVIWIVSKTQTLSRNGARL